MSDNFQVRVASAGYDHFVKAFHLACGTRKATHYCLKEASKKQASSLTFYWTMPADADNFEQLPFEMSGAALCDFAWNWLQQATYQPEPDHDGDNKKGFLLTNGDGWTGIIDESHYGLVKISTDWQMYGK